MGIRDKIKKYENEWQNKCYTNGIPDEAPVEISHLVPSYKQIAICLLKNDMNLIGLGYTSKKSTYYGVLKRMELKERGVLIQLSLF